MGNIPGAVSQLFGYKHGGPPPKCSSPPTHRFANYTKALNMSNNKAQGSTRDESPARAPEHGVVVARKLWGRRGSDHKAQYKVITEHPHQSPFDMSPMEMVTTHLNDLPFALDYQPRKAKAKPATVRTRCRAEGCAGGWTRALKGKGGGTPQSRQRLAVQAHPLPPSNSCTTTTSWSNGAFCFTPSCRVAQQAAHLSQFFRTCPLHRNRGATNPPTPPPLKSTPPPGGEPSPWPRKHTKYQPPKFLQGAEADLHCDTMVQICGAVSPPPRGGTVTL